MMGLIMILALTLALTVDTRAVLDSQQALTADPQEWYSNLAMLSVTQQQCLHSVTVWRHVLWNCSKPQQYLGLSLETQTHTHFHLDPSPDHPGVPESLSCPLDVICEVKEHLLSLEKNQSGITGVSHASQTPCLSEFTWLEV